MAEVEGPKEDHFSFRASDLAGQIRSRDDAFRIIRPMLEKIANVEKQRDEHFAEIKRAQGIIDDLSVKHERFVCMPLPELLDDWEHLPNDLKGDIAEASPTFAAKMRAIFQTIGTESK